jgi:hypothetical protein
MAAAYAYADGGHPSYEMELLGYLDRYGGALNVLGRPLGLGEMRRMTTAEHVFKWYQERQVASSFAEWAESNASKADVLHTAYKYAVELKLIEGEHG